MLDLKGERQSLKKIYILYTSYAALGGGGRVSSHFLLGLPHPCMFSLAGPPAWPAVHAGAGHHLLLREAS